jgi:hypothetical protein
VLLFWSGLFDERWQPEIPIKFILSQLMNKRANFNYFIFLYGRKRKRKKQ